MRRLRLPAVLAVTVFGGAACTSGTGPELDAHGPGANDHGQLRDGGTDGPGMGSGARDAAFVDSANAPMPDAPGG